MLLYIVILYQRILEEEHGDRFPYAHLHNPYAPVPAKVVGCLAVVDTQLLFPVIVAGRIIITERGAGRHHHLYGGVETDIEFVFPFGKHISHQYPVTHEHVLRAKYA